MSHQLSKVGLGLYLPEGVVSPGLDYVETLEKLTEAMSERYGDRPDFSRSDLKVVVHRSPSSWEGTRTIVHKPTLVCAVAGGLALDNFTAEPYQLGDHEFPEINLDAQTARSYGQWGWYKNRQVMDSNGVKTQDDFFRVVNGNVRPAIELGCLSTMNGYGLPNFNYDV